MVHLSVYRFDEKVSLEGAIETISWVEVISDRPKLDFAQNIIMGENEMLVEEGKPKELTFDDPKARFQVELEFVQCLSNPKYITCTVPAVDT